MARLSLSLATVLGFLLDNSGKEIWSGDVLREANISPSNVAESFNYLERLGWVTRTS